MRYYICYDKNGAFLGGLTHKRKPSFKNCKEVSAEEYKRILALNGITFEEKPAENETPTEENVVEKTSTEENVVEETSTEETVKEDA